MLPALTILKASLGAGSFLKAPVTESRPAAAAPQVQPVLIPIRSVGPGERDRIARHLLALETHDRYLRFGYPATDEQIQTYVDALNFERDEIFGIYNRKLEIIAMSHLAFPPADQARDCAEFGVSVSTHARGRGYGARLFERAEVSARNEGVGMLFIHALSENAAMLHIARKAGASVVRTGSESEAHLRLPEATLDSRISEIALDQFAEFDFRLKSRAKQFWDFLAGVQEVRRGVQESRAKSSA
ncbi:GNAT family N-acetyltransferase [Variovorax sp. J22R133]|uniref:GNAT family N-acetyltransferase n=1 Tax=Variovorax brevis TaxID=3053503 RepID=UPI0025753EAB|nr:GNAT family N-acetyltransferase [Variovorax sp. J22R133]MDM0114806.1 GNAT family N-acetyltransferase [Variovorax sp. J22R133]